MTNAKQIENLYRTPVFRTGDHAFTYAPGKALHGSPVLIVSVGMSVAGALYRFKYLPPSIINGNEVYQVDGAEGLVTVSQWEECKKNPTKPNLPIGTRVIYLPFQDDSCVGTVIRQTTSSNRGCGTTMSYLDIQMDDGHYVRANQWQCREI